MEDKKLTCKHNFVGLRDNARKLEKKTTFFSEIRELPEENNNREEIYGCGLLQYGVVVVVVVISTSKMLGWKSWLA